jgi:hypothetical protein
MAGVHELLWECAHIQHFPRQSLGLHDRAQLSADYRPTKNCMCALGLKRRFSRCSYETAVVGYSPDNNDVNAEAEESPLLNSVTWKRQVKEDGENLACAVVTCKVRRLAIML